jgi:hypothetical protein
MLAEYAAVKARLNAHTSLAGKGSDSIRMENGLPVRATYWVLFGGPPDTLDDDRLAATQKTDSDAEYVYTFRFVSVTHDAVLQGAQAALAQLLDWTPTVAGRSCQPIALDDGVQPVDADTRVTPPLLFVDLDFVLKSNRA